MKPIIGIYGGTFDPVHEGHLQTANFVKALFPTMKMHFVPCKIPVLKAAAKASNAQRLAMLELALKGNADKVIDKRELVRKTPSYMNETLASFRHDFPTHSLALILGMDAFCQLPRWHEWESLLDYAHLLVLKRDEPTLDAGFQAWIKNYRSDTINTLTQTPNGTIYFLDNPIIDISSTHIRQCIAQGEIPQNVPEVVLNYIHQHQLYGA